MPVQADHCGGFEASCEERVDHTTRFADSAAAVAMLRARTLVLDRKVAVSTTRYVRASGSSNQIPTLTPSR
jgi:hypothetical protein